MKKFILVLFGLFITSSALAGVAIFNMNDKSDIDFTYRFCYVANGGKILSCDKPSSIIVKAKKLPDDKNYVVIAQPTPNEPVSVLLQPISALEKDDRDNIISQGKYADETLTNNLMSNSLCGTWIWSLNQDGKYAKNYNAAIILNDMKQSPYILCQNSTWVFDNTD